MVILFEGCGHSFLLFNFYISFHNCKRLFNFIMVDSLPKLSLRSGLLSHFLISFLMFFFFLYFIIEICQLAPPLLILKENKYFFNMSCIENVKDKVEEILSLPV